jgi:hypothetical protein
MKPRVIKSPQLNNDSPALSQYFFEKFNIEDKIEVTFNGHLEVAATETPEFYQANIAPGQQESLAGTLKQYKFTLSPQKDILFILNLDKDYNLIVPLSSCAKIIPYIP